MQLFINNWAAALTAPVFASDAWLSVDPTLAAELVGLGSGDYYLLTLASVGADGVETAHEVVEVTAVVDGVMTVERGREGTAAADWPAASGVSARITKGTLERLRDASAAYAPSLVTNFSGPKMLGLADVNTFAVSQDATAQLVTIPSQVEVGWGAGAEIRFQQGGVGTLSVVGGGGVSINHEADFSTATYGQFSVITLKRTGNDTWSLFGALAYSGSPGS